MSAFHDIIASQLAGFLFHTAVMHCLCVSFSQLQGHGWGQLAGMGVCVCVFEFFCLWPASWHGGHVFSTRSLKKSNKYCEPNLT